MVSAETVLAEFNIVPVIIFLVVIGKIIKTIKDAASKGAAPPQRNAVKKQKLEEDLERFFERLATQSGPAEEAAPPPVPAAAKSIPKAKPVVVQAAPAQQKREPKPAARPAAAVELKPQQVTVLRPAQAWGGVDYGMQASVPKGAVCSYGPAAARKEIVAMIKDDKSIRKAMLLREILGPPVSLR